MNNSEQKSFKDSLNLPKTDFSIRADSKIKEPTLLKKWSDINLNNKTFTKNEGFKKFVFLDGPPYANGHIHMGTAFNKILKDILLKARRMQGYHVPFVPGWDCHGLPIEFKVVSELGLDKDSSKIDALKLKKACRAYATKWIDTQKEEFKNLGVLADWDNPYLTMDYKYEANIIRAFAKFVENGFIERKGKTTPWCAHCQTTLATAEIEYQDRKDPSCYIYFPIDEHTTLQLFPKIDGLHVGFLVWTTTPWTIPLNRAIVLNPSADYVLLQLNDTRAIIVGEALADTVCKQLDIEKKILAEIPSSIFKDIKVHHPFINIKVPIILNEIVTLEDGTACMHMAPGCGPEDYLIAVKHGIEIYSPLTSDGRYSSEIEPVALKGMSIVDGQIWVIKKLAETENLIYKTSIRHSYPHCWRCHNGLMFRATLQWFCNLQKQNLIEETLKEIESIFFIPEQGKARLKATIANRTEWCISRQRYWGVPIPALLCYSCDNVFIDKEFIIKISKGIEENGIEYWDKISVHDMKTQGLIVNDFVCNKCGSSELRKESDILDVWFDSGVAHYAVLKQNKNLGFSSEFVFEGSDQHRGWFQSSMLTSMILNGSKYSKRIVTHGFVVDEKGYKMSKSVGNVIAPQQLIDLYGRDIVRLWAAGSNYSNDIILSETVMKTAAEVYRKIRNTSRFLLSNLYDFDINKDKVALEHLLAIDQYALSQIKELSEKIQKAYDNYNVTEIFHLLSNYCATDLSAFYLDIIKDRFYVEKSNGILRRSAQTVSYYILDTLTRLMAPILSFLAEEIYEHYQPNNKKESIHLESFALIPEIWNSELSLTREGQWILIKELRSVVLKALEEERAKGLIKHSLEAKVILNLDSSHDSVNAITSLPKTLSVDMKDRFFKDLFIVSQCEFIDSNKDLNRTEISWVNIKIQHADGTKCPRCWQWELSQQSDGLCKRCVNALGL